MAKKLLPDALWDEIAPLFPPDPPRPKGGRPPVGSREALIGILFVLYTAIPWERLPFEVAGCSGMTCWRRLRAWQDAGLWHRIHRHMLDRLNLAGHIDWTRAAVDASSVAAKRMARPVGKWSQSNGLNSLHKRIRPFGEPLAKMESRASWFS